MLKLVGCQYKGVPKFGEFEINDFGVMTSLTGPNGSGKTSILKILEYTFGLLSKHSLADVIPPSSDWFGFSEAHLKFSNVNRDLPHFEGYFSSQPNENEHLELDLRIDADRFEITKISIGNASLSLSEVPNKVVLDQLQEVKQQLLREISTKQSHLASPISSQIQNNPAAHKEERDRRVRLKQELDNVTQQKEKVDAEIELGKKIAVNFGGELRTIPRGEAEGLLSSLGIPRIQYVDMRKLYDELVPKMIEDLMVQKKGPNKQYQQYKDKCDALGEFIQAKVDVFEGPDGKNTLTVRGVDYSKLSSGTQISIAFFAGTHADESDYLILWDEPENGLHPTRRVRLLELILADKRQFVLATHASEFTPMLINSEIKAYRCEAQSYEEDTQVRLSIHSIVNRRDAFVTLEAMGVNPARILFTANVVIWIEGPTELLFYRHWLVPRLAKHELHEGFHYTFMQYGGSLISYLEVADAVDGGLGTTELNSAFDLLSLCRHPVIIVDSDLKEAPTSSNPKDFLKKGAGRILTEIEQMNALRPDAGLFSYTSGREVENYLPEFALASAIKSVWKSYSKYETELSLDQIQIECFDSYDEKLASHFIAKGIVDDDKLPRGRSLWGGTNKVEMMRCALNTAELKEEHLKWNCSLHLQMLENFVVKAAEK